VQTIFMRLLLVVFASLSGYIMLRQIVGDHEIALTGFISGMLIALAALKFEERVNKTPLKIVLGGGIGLITGLIVANLFTYPLVPHFFENAYLEVSAYIFTNSVLGYLGLSIGMKKGEELNLDFSELLKRKGSAEEEGKKNRPTYVLDTSVIIDGRVADICQTGFVDGLLIVPRFVLGELQYIADSEDPLKKARGARGLDILEKLQKEKNIEVQISDNDFPDIHQVDMKLISFAQKHKARILTNDVNLNKIANLRGVPVLNLNSLANSLKPVVLPGEGMTITVIKEGREDGQGVGYLDDGTMVVVDNASSLQGKTVDIAVTSILQTTTGRMIFAKMKDQKKAAPKVRAVPN